jgi:hypothetical protein
VFLGKVAGLGEAFVVRLDPDLVKDLKGDAGASQRVHGHLERGGNVEFLEERKELGPNWLYFR